MSELELESNSDFQTHILSLIPYVLSGKQVTFEDMVLFFRFSLILGVPQEIHQYVWYRPP